MPSPPFFESLLILLPIVWLFIICWVLRENEAQDASDNDDVSKSSCKASHNDVADDNDTSCKSDPTPVVDTGSTMSIDQTKADTDQTYQDTIAQLHTVLREKASRLKDLEKEVAEQKALLEQKEDEINEKDKSLKERSQTISTREEKIQELASKNADLNKKLGRQTKRLADQLLDIQGLEGEVKTANSNMKKLEKAKEALEESKIPEIEDLETDLEAQQLENDQAQKNLNEAHSQVETLQKHLEDANGEIETQRRSVEQLKKEKADMEQKYNDLKAEKERELANPRKHQKESVAEQNGSQAPPDVAQTVMLEVQHLVDVPDAEAQSQLYWQRKQGAPDWETKPVENAEEKFAKILQDSKVDSIVLKNYNSLKEETELPSQEAGSERKTTQVLPDVAHAKRSEVHNNVEAGGSESGSRPDALRKEGITPDLRQKLVEQQKERRRKDLLAKNLSDIEADIMVEKSYNSSKAAPKEELSQSKEPIMEAESEPKIRQAGIDEVQTEISTLRDNVEGPSSESESQPASLPEAETWFKPQPAGPVVHNQSQPKRSGNLRTGSRFDNKRNAATKRNNRYLSRIGTETAVERAIELLGAEHDAAVAQPSTSDKDVGLKLSSDAAAEVHFKCGTSQTGTFNPGVKVNPPDNQMARSIESTTVQDGETAAVPPPTTSKYEERPADNDASNSTISILNNQTIAPGPAATAGSQNLDHEDQDQPLEAEFSVQDDTDYNDGLGSLFDSSEEDSEVEGPTTQIGGEEGRQDVGEEEGGEEEEEEDEEDDEEDDDDDSEDDDNDEDDEGDEEKGDTENLGSAGAVTIGLRLGKYVVERPSEPVILVKPGIETIAALQNGGEHQEINENACGGL
ncbi:hypothetical protein LTS07_006110 [Exophiala sideris]|uniref:Uncharacterized protein n=1 Tax=Exophiala sideris TaxID=1016849 RepID=A0ABR0J6H7_9EURO|nr:hypothetical protein LTS07_006110 [Exophiala sideris]KAK5035599.1 hypothetical protein LTR13_005728 [Exophiala sideris]KAK5057235.1 hypothetical protein LTR69_007274 [Exophiala sideris]KAK5181792.1 hypothetical protein LTR44_005992 [Eurotiomycetes sp. CCFEE 6388]